MIYRLGMLLLAGLWIGCSESTSVPEGETAREDSQLVSRKGEPSPGKSSGSGESDLLTVSADADPEALAEKLRALDEELRRIPQRGQMGVSRNELMSDFLALQETRVEAAGAMFDHPAASPEQRREAAEMKLESLMMLGSAGVESAAASLRQFAKRLREQDDAALARQGRLVAFQLEVAELADSIEPESLDPSDPPAEVGQMRQRLNELLANEEQRDAELLHAAGIVPATLMNLGLFAPAAEIREELLTIFAEIEALAMERRMLEEEAYLSRALAVSVGVPDQREPLQELFDSIFSRESLGRPHQGLAKQVAQLLEQAGQIELAEQTLAAAEEKLRAANETRLADELRDDPIHKRLALVGEPFSIEGVLASGKKLDWSQFDDKVVLVDFWATWCQPCVEELPNVYAAYQNYHDRGFEVLGVNIDEDPAAIDEFGPVLEKQIGVAEFPWPNIVRARGEAESSDLPQPNLKEIGLQSIPFLVLVGRDGKVLDLHTRGERLDAKLAELFPAESDREEEMGAIHPDWQFVADEGGAPVEEDEGETPAEDAEVPELDLSNTNPYRASPNLSTLELIDWIFRMEDKPKAIQLRPGFAMAVSEAADRVMAAKKEGRFFVIAAEAKIKFLHRDACLGDEKAQEQLTEFIRGIAENPPERLADDVELHTLEAAALEVDSLKMDEVPGFLEKLAAFFDKHQDELEQRHLRLASLTVRAINRLEDGKTREEKFASFGNLFAKSDDRELSRYGKKLAQPSGGGESELVGQPLEIAGTTTLGNEFDWKAYRGKYVLVEFWATWCGPCRREMPAVRAMYEKYKDQGFDIVGISVDEDAEALAAFLEREKLPWTILNGEKSSAAAKRYGVRGIPTMMLVDPEGKVVKVAHAAEAIRAAFEAKLEEAEEAEEPAEQD